MMQRSLRNTTTVKTAALPTRGRFPLRVPVNPYYIGGLGLLLAAVFVLWGYFGFGAFRSSLLAAVEREGHALLESLVQATEVTAQANQFMRLQQIRILSDKAALIAAEAAGGQLDLARPDQFCADNDLDGLAILGPEGIITAVPPVVHGFMQADDRELTDAVENLGRGLAPWETIYRLDSATGEEWIGALVGGKTGQGVNVYSAWQKVTRIEELFRDVGIGRLIQMVGQKAGINYILLQTPAGLTYASRPVKPVLRIASDQFLVDAIAADRIVTRQLIFEGQEVLETVRPFVSEHVAHGVIRIGLNLAATRQAEAQLKNQLVFSSIFLGLLTLVAVGFVVVRQNLTAVSRSYAQISTLTGRILDAMEGAVVAINAEGGITHFNPAAERLFCKTATEVYGLPVEQLFPDDEVGLLEVTRSGRALTERDWLRRVDGHQQYLTAGASPIRQPDGTSGGAVAVIVDQTEARRMNERIRRAERLSEMGTMAAGVAHEIRNPLNAIALAAQRLSIEFEVKDHPDDFLQFTGLILSESRRLDKIVDDFLDLARPPREEPQRFALTEVLNQVTGLMVLEAKDKGLSLSTTPEADVTLFGLPGELKKALINVISNAIAATPEKGTVQVSSLKDAETRQAIIRVVDSGIGIPPEHQDKIFQPYFSTKAQGTGLGLAITARIIADFVGTIELDSSLDRGTTVEIRLPLADG